MSMNWRAAKGKCAVIVAIGLILAAAAPPDRNANIWNGKDHEPNAAAVRARENHAGILPPAQQRQSQDRALESRTRRIIGEATHAAPLAKPTPPPAP